MPGPFTPHPGALTPKPAVAGRHLGRADSGDLIDLRETRGSVGIVGLGYVGLPTAIGLWDAGAKVVGFDISTDRLDHIRRVRVDLLDFEIDRLKRAVDDERFHLTDDPAALSSTDTVIVCVPTPVDACLVPDLGPLAGACRLVVEHARKGQLIVLTSTTYVGCTRDFLVQPLQDRGFEIGTDINVAFSPERIDPGNIEHPQETVPRVLGGVTASCVERGRDVIGRVAPMVHLVESPEVAELTKLYENTFRAVNIALANELADVCTSFSIDVREVLDAAGSKPYGFMKFTPGPGVGGHCIPCDPHYLLWQLKGDRREAPLIERAMAAIAGRPRRVVERLVESLADQGKVLRGSRVHVVGVAYKPAVEDMRESPALEIIDELLAGGAVVTYVDDFVPALNLPSGRRLASTAVEASEVDAILVHTLHPGVHAGAFADAPLVFDASYRLGYLPQRVQP